MTGNRRMIWYWSLPILPFTAIITCILTLVVYSQLLHITWSGEKLQGISVLGTGRAYPYFVSGFIILTLQFLLILIGRLQFLFQSQSVIHRAILCIIHAIATVSCVFLLITVIVSLDDRPLLHVYGAFGMFAFISLYCLLHTIAVFYLFSRRSVTPEHSNILWPLWFLVCSILLIIFSSTWIVKGKAIPQCIAAAMPFFYILGFIPQFWTQSKRKKHDDNESLYVHYSNQMSL